MKQALFFLILLQGILPSLFAQAENETPFFEQILLQSDRDLYLAGEIIWFTAHYLLDKELGNEAGSKVLYVELYDEQKEVVAQKKLTIEKGSANGSLNLPSELISGNYFLRTYTLYQRNLPPSAWATKWLTIINPRLPLRKRSASDSLSSGSTKANVVSSDLNSSGAALPFQLKPDKLIYTTREKVNLGLLPLFPEESEDYCDLSVSVVLKGTRQEMTEELPAHLRNNPVLHPAYLFNQGAYPGSGAKASQMPSSQMEWVPEVRGLSINGKVRDRRTLEPVVGVRCLASVLGERAQVHINRTDSTGKFIVVLHRLVDMQNIVLTVDHPDAENMELLVQSDFSGSFAPLETIPLQVGPTDKEVLEKMLLSPQLSKSFDLPTAVPRELPANLPFNLLKPEVSILLKDYIKMPSLEEVFNELIPAVKTKASKGETKLILTDMITQQTYADPLVLLDYLPVFDVEKLLNVNPAKIEKIEVINRQYVLGDYTINGVILISSNTDNFADLEISEQTSFVNFLTLSKPENFYSPVYLTETERSQRLPDFRTTLYWNPSVRMRSAKQTLSFYTSDQQGTYEIIVRGISSNGQAVFGRSEIQVVPE